MYSPGWRPYGPKDRVREARVEMINETSAFLTWALRAHEDMPRIPARKVDDGGFNLMMKMPAFRQMVAEFWEKILGALWWED